MLRRRTGSAALAITLLALLTLARPLSAQNLLINGGFETSTVGNWNFDYGAGGCDLGTTAHSDNFAVQVSRPSSRTSPRRARQRSLRLSVDDVAVTLS